MQKIHLDKIKSQFYKNYIKFYKKKNKILKIAEFTQIILIINKVII